MATVETLLSAEEYLQLPDDGQLTELVRGQVVTMTLPVPWHGYFCCKISRIVGNFVDDLDLGRVMTNDSGVITERDPDTVRGPDVSFYSYKRLPKGTLPKTYLSVSPELLFEVRSPSDRMSKILIKVGEFLDADVLCVCVVDPETETITVYRPDQPPKVLNKTDILDLHDILPNFRVEVRRFFE